MSNDIEIIRKKLEDLTENDAERVDELNRLATAYAVESDPTRALAIGEEARKLAEELGYAQGHADGVSNLAFAHYLLSDHETALRVSHDAINEYEALGDERGLANALGVLASIQQSLGDYDEAFSTANRSLELQRSNNDRMREAWLLNGLGGGYHEIGDYERAVAHHEQSLEIFEDLEHKIGTARALNGLGTVYQSEGEYEKASDYHNRSLVLFKETNNKLGEARALNDLGVIHQKLGEYDQAFDCHEESLSLRKEVGNRQAQSTSLINLGNLYIEKKEPAMAFEVLHRALTIAMEIRVKPRIYQANLALSEAHELNGDFEEALQHYKIYQSVKEDVAGDQAVLRMRNLQIGFEVESTRKEAEISRLKNVELKEKNEQLESLLRELKETQTQLIQTEKMAALGRLIAGVVHEINNPVGAINSATDVTLRALRRVREAIDSSPSIEELRQNSRFKNAVATLESDTNVTLDATHRISSVVKDLKSFIHLDEADIQDIDVRDGLESTLNLLQHEYGDRIQVVRELDDIPLVRCNAGEMNQVFMNLLTNAGEAIVGEGTITVKTNECPPSICIEISDTGVGIPEVHMKRLFDPTISKKGTRVKAGLGLFTSYNIVQKNAGDISVDSEVGKGTKFTLRLPAASQSGSGEAAGNAS